MPGDRAGITPSGPPDLWARLARLRPRWTIRVEAAFIRDHGRDEEHRWRATLRERGAGAARPERLVVEAGSLSETLLRAAVAAEAREAGAVPGRSAGSERSSPRRQRA